MITQKLKTMTDATDSKKIRSKRKAITAFFPYAVIQERDGECDMFRLFLNTARASHQWKFMWHRIEPVVAPLLNEKSNASLKLAVILVSPHLPWTRFTNGEHLTQLWTAAASEIPYTDEVGQTVVDTLLQIASDDSLRPHIPDSMWPWLNRPSSLPPVCWGRYCGNHADTIKTIRALGDIETLKSYLLLVLSEWDCPDLHGTRTSIREDFSGTGMGRHREDLLQRLDHVLGQLGLGLEHLRQHNLNLNEHRIRQTKERCEELKAVLLEVDGEAINTLIREPPRLVIFFDPLTPTDIHRVPLNLYMRVTSPMSVVACLDHPPPLPPTRDSSHPLCFFSPSFKPWCYCHFNQELNSRLRLQLWYPNVTCLFLRFTAV